MECNSQVTPPSKARSSGLSKALQITQMCDPVSGSASWHVSGCDSWRELGASWLSLNQHILAALQQPKPWAEKGPGRPPKRSKSLLSEPRWASEWRMSETLDCFEACQSPFMQEKIADTLVDEPSASEVETNTPSTPCTPELRPHEIPCQWSSDQQPQLFLLPQAPGTQKVERSARHAGVSGRRGPTSYPPPYSCQHLGECQVPSRSVSLASAERTTESLSSGKRMLKRSRSAEVPRSSLDNDNHFSNKHEPTPVALSVQCELCGQSSPLGQLAAHIREHFTQDVCCPNQGCDWRGQSDFLKTHLEEVCLRATIPCPFAASGCPAHVPRGKLGSHLVESIEDHLLLVAYENKMLRTRLHDMGATQTLLQNRVENLEMVVLDFRTDESADDASSVCSSAESDGVSAPTPRLD